MARIIAGRHRRVRKARELNAELATWIWTGQIELDPPAESSVRLDVSQYTSTTHFLEDLKRHVDERR
ncbi:MAG TPA: hypothetical protein VGD74_01140 [Vulgatibacter sp.]